MSKIIFNDIAYGEFNSINNSSIFEIELDQNSMQQSTNSVTYNITTTYSDAYAAAEAGKIFYTRIDSDTALYFSSITNDSNGIAGSLSFVTPINSSLYIQNITFEIYSDVSNQSYMSHNLFIIPITTTSN